MKKNGIIKKITDKSGGRIGMLREIIRLQWFCYSNSRRKELNLWRQTGGCKIHLKSPGTYQATTRIRTDGTLELLAYNGLKFIGRENILEGLSRVTEHFEVMDCCKSFL